MKTSIILKQARDLISDPKRWCQSALGLKDGHSCKLHESDQNCALGAIKRVSDDAESIKFACMLSDDGVKARRHLEWAAATLFRDHVIGVNNDRRPEAHDNVLKMFDHAIGIAKTKEQENQQ